jgi:hypothetical protein
MARRAPFQAATTKKQAILKDYFITHEYRPLRLFDHHVGWW